MPAASVAYHFSQRFPCPARELFEWATDFDGEDLARMGHPGTRKVRWLCNDTVVLTDAAPGASGKKVIKTKLVRIYRRQRTWTNTHLSGPNVHSQFLYQIVEEAPERCRLDFSGLQMVEVERADRKTLQALAKQIRADDSASWRALAAAKKAGR